ncbi:MAG TPA: hypothetical protein VF240_16940 [Pyrinomonadaceae bacterium]
MDDRGEGGATARAERRTLLALVAAVLFGLGSAAALTRWSESLRPVAGAPEVADELYLKPETARRLSLNFNGLVADWYWMRSLQYVGRKVLAYEGQLQLDDLSPLKLKVLAPLLEQTTTLDPHFYAAYEYGAVVLPAVDREAAVRLVQKGIDANPREWRLYHQLGYIHWQGGQFKEAARVYEEGAQQSDAPTWMRAMPARLEAEGGDRSLAREMFTRLHNEAGDEQIKELAIKRLAQLRSLDERDAIRRVLAIYRERALRCPESWAAIAPVLSRVPVLRLGPDGAPLDPTDKPYVLTAGGCEVELGLGSEILRQ